jgi:ribosomal protein S18 acetylase RimI-like enzyme
MDGHLEKSMGDLNHDYNIAYGAPDIADYLRLRREGGLSAFSEEAAILGLQGTLFAVTVHFGGKTVGMGRLVGDGGCFFQIVDIAVDPAHRGLGLGKRIMSELMTYVNATLPKSALVSLLADVPANRLYEQFGFKETAPRSLGMAYKVK